MASISKRKARSNERNHTRLKPGYDHHRHNNVIPSMKTLAPSMVQPGHLWVSVWVSVGTSACLPCCLFPHAHYIRSIPFCTFNYFFLFFPLFYFPVCPPLCLSLNLLFCCSLFCWRRLLSALLRLPVFLSSYQSNICFPVAEHVC